jgi:outer membrane protein assembly factor BamB
VNAILAVFLSLSLLTGITSLAANPDHSPAADHWPQFRGPGGLGVSADQGLPINWGPTQNLAWKVALPGKGSSSPIVVGSRVIVTCYSGAQDQVSRQVLCFNRADGKLLWTADVPSKLPEGRVSRGDHGYASSTPATDGERVYAFFGKSGVFAFDLNGRQLWHADVGEGVHEFGSGASLVLYKDLVIVNASVESGALIGLDAKSGKEAWREGGIVESWCTPVLVEAEKGKTELVLPMKGKLVAHDPQTGKRLWSCATGINSYVVPSAVAAEGVVYMIGGRPSGSLAVRAGGSGDVTATHRLWTAKKGAIVTSPVYHDGHLYWIGDGRIACCLDARTGNVVVEERLAGGGGEFWGSALLAEGKVYFFSHEGGASVVLAAKPKFETLAVNDRLEQWNVNFDSSPVPSSGQLLVRSNRHLFCLGKK